MPAQSAKVSTYLKQKVIDKTGVSVARVEFLADAYQKQIRKLNKEYVLGQLPIDLAFIAQNYGARQEIQPRVLTECVRLVLSKFSHLAINEIKEAYMSWASGEIEVKGGEMYGGVFNAAQLGKVLGAYSKNRNEIMRILLTERNKELDFIRSKQRENEMKQQFEDNFENMLADGKSNFKDWRYVPVYWFEMLRKRGLLKITKDQADRIFEDAKELAIIELQNRNEEESNPFKKWREEDLESITKSIARKVAVFRLYIQL